MVRNGNVPIPPFDIRPSVLEVGPGQTGLMEIVFQPPAVKSYSVDMCMVCDNCNVKHFKITGKYLRSHVKSFLFLSVYVHTNIYVLLSVKYFS